MLWWHVPATEQGLPAVHDVFDCLRTVRKNIHIEPRPDVQGKAASETLPERPRKLVKLVKQCQLQSGASDQVIRKLGSDLEMVVAFHQLSQLQVNCALARLPCI